MGKIATGATIKRDLVKFHGQRESVEPIYENDQPELGFVDEKLTRNRSFSPRFPICISNSWTFGKNRILHHLWRIQNERGISKSCQQLFWFYRGSFGTKSSLVFCQIHNDPLWHIKIWISTFSTNWKRNCKY